MMSIVSMGNSEILSRKKQLTADFSVESSINSETKMKKQNMFPLIFEILLLL